MTTIATTRVRHGNDDLVAVNAARCSFSKHHDTFDLPGDRRLLHFLARENHFVPYCHGHLLLRREMPERDYLRYVTYAGAGHAIEITSHGPRNIGFVERGSLWFWLRNLRWMPPELPDILHRRFPESWQAVADETDLTLAPSNADGRVVEDMTEAAPEEELEALVPLMDREQAERLATITFHLKVPVFVARQLEKHRVDLVMNGEIEEGEPAQSEVSRRYVDSEPELYWPETWRRRAADKKQGSLDEAVEGMRLRYGMTGTAEHDGWAPAFESFTVAEADRMLRAHAAESVGLYVDAVASGVAPEQARMILPQAALTEFHLTGSVDAFRRIADLRLKPDAQAEARDAVAPIAEALAGLRAAP